MTSGDLNALVLLGLIVAVVITARVMAWWYGPTHRRRRW